MLGLRRMRSPDFHTMFVWYPLFSLLLLGSFSYVVSETLTYVGPKLCGLVLNNIHTIIWYRVGIVYILFPDEYYYILRFTIVYTISNLNLVK